jgi:hypothetical protein
LRHRGQVRANAVSPDGQCRFLSSLDDSIILRDITSGKEVYTLPDGL